MIPHGSSTLPVTTGRLPKAPFLPTATFFFATLGWCADLMHLEPEDVGLHAAPLSHGAGFPRAGPHRQECGAGDCGVAALLIRRLFCETRTSPPGHQQCASTDTGFKRLISFEGLRKYDLSTLRYLAYYGSPMYVEDLKETLRKMGPIFVQIYGQGGDPNDSDLPQARRALR